MNGTEQKKSNKNVLYIILVVILIVVIVVEGGLILNKMQDKDVTDNSKPGSRTIMIYMVGADLESSNGIASFDLSTIDYKKTSAEDTKVVLIAGGSKQWNNDYVDVDETSIYELKKGGFEKVKKQNIQNMGEPKVLSNFLDYVYENYKTDKYNLMFWDHGSAILGSEHDELANDFLSLYEINKGLSGSPFNKNNKLETIIFRTCLNGNLEVASMLGDYADYLVASEEVTIGNTMDSPLEFINKIKQEDTSYDMALKFIDSYKGLIGNYKNLYFSYTGNTPSLYSTYSIIDLSNVDNLIDSVNDFFEDIDVSKNYNDIARVRNGLYQYGDTEKAYDMVDLYNLVDSLKSYSSAKADKVLNNFENTVLYNFATNNKSRGLSIYFPYQGSSAEKEAFLKIYQSFDDLEDYYSFIKRFNSIQTSTSYNFSFAQNDVKIDKNSSEPDFTLQLTDEQLEGFASAQYIVFKAEKDGYFTPIYRGKEVKLNGNTLTANIKDRQLKIVGEDKDGNHIEDQLHLSETENNDKYIEYQTAVILENFSDEDISKWLIDSAMMTLVYNKETQKIGISKLLLISDDEDLPNTVAVDINKYTHIVFGSSKYKILDKNGNYTTDWESNGIFEGIESEVEALDLRIDKLDDGADYYCVFQIYDTTNNSYFSKLVKM